MPFSVPFHVLHVALQVCIMSYSLHVLCHMSYFIYHMSEECLFTYSINIVFLKLVVCHLVCFFMFSILFIKWYTILKPILRHLVCLLHVLHFTLRSCIIYFALYFICPLSYILWEVVYILYLRFVLYLMPNVIWQVLFTYCSSDLRYILCPKPMPYGMCPNSYNMCPISYTICSFLTQMLHSL